MTALVLALLGLAPNPVPDNKTTIDSFSFSFGAPDKHGGKFDTLALGGAPALGAGGSLTVAKDGKVTYTYSSAPFTGSGGRVVKKEWALSKDELKALFAKLVADGLLDGDANPDAHSGIRVTSGRWYAYIEQVPEKAMAHIKVLLVKADPVLWEEKKPAPKPPAPKPGVLRQFNYYFAPKADGDHALLYVGRTGEVSYQRYGPTPGVPQSTTTHVQTSWKIEPADAERLLDALAAGGALDLEIAEREKFPIHRVEAQVGRWNTTHYTKPLPDPLLKLLLPLLKKADAGYWK
ncbi:MAG: hypothetical protein FJ304_07750 [Planctomycetes bacterium]|nr:hypothetical protein [Planctomycetota bacterium]